MRTCSPAHVTSTYFVLIGCRYSELGRTVRCVRCERFRCLQVFRTRIQCSIWAVTLCSDFLLVSPRPRKRPPAGKHCSSFQLLLSFLHRFNLCDVYEALSAVPLTTYTWVVTPVDWQSTCLDRARNFAPSLQQQSFHRQTHNNISPCQNTQSYNNTFFICYSPMR